MLASPEAVPMSIETHVIPLPANSLTNREWLKGFEQPKQGGIA